MPQIQYRGIDKKGLKVSGSMEAVSENEVRSKLRSLGIRPTFISKAGFSFNLFNSVPGEVLVVFTRQIQVLINAGVPLVQSLEMLTGQLKTLSKRMSSVVENIRTGVSEGKYLWEAVSQYPNIFPKLYIALIRSGETSGQLEKTLQRLTKYLEDSEKLKKTLKGALIYPIGVIAVAIGVIVLMLVMVIPKFEELLKSAGQELPGPTKFLINVSHFIIDHWLFLITLCTTVGVAFYMFVTSPEGRRIIQRAFFRTPLFGTILQKGSVARFCRTMHALLSSGINLLDAVQICQETIDNAVVEDDIRKIRPEIERGKTLGEVISRLKSLPSLATQMISTGEATGSLDKMLEKVADFYETEVEALVAGMTKLIEPILIVVLGTLVGGILVAMYLPIFKLASAMG
jgi:type IV pilus assembly protein PilC